MRRGGTISVDFSLFVLLYNTNFMNKLFLITFVSKVSPYVFDLYLAQFKGIVSRDFEWLQIILMNRLYVPDVPLEVYSFLNFRFHKDF